MGHLSALVRAKRGTGAPACAIKFLIKMTTQRRKHGFRQRDEPKAVRITYAVNCESLHSMLYHYVALSKGPTSENTKVPWVCQDNANT